MEQLEYTPASAGVAVGNEPSISVPLDELVKLCALDTELYCHTFFPKTFRQKSPPFHRDLYALFDNPLNRYCAAEVFRGGAKTTIARAGVLSKRIAYGVTRTAMFLSSSQEHAKRSVLWIRKQVQFNKTWAQTFGLVPGDKWTDEFIEIKHTTLGFTCAVIAVGMTGQTRGVNIDDYRPDLIVVDDPDDEETTATPEQREKTERRFFGAIEKSLTPATENPEAKLILLQTSLHRDDLINRCHKDSEWATLRFSALDEAGRSRWPDRWSTETLLTSKRAHIQRGQTLLWLREMECTVGDAETAYFSKDWLLFWDTLPEKMIVVLVVDPTPPPSEHQIAKGLQNKDFEVVAAVGYHRGKFYVLEYAASRGHEPEWTIAEFFRLRSKWKPLKARVEGNAYQRTLKWILEKAMKERHEYIEINAEPSKISKHHRIRQALSGIASTGSFLIGKDMTELAMQFTAYPNVKNDDVLDAVAMGVETLLDVAPGFSDMDFDSEETDQLLPDWRTAP